MQDLRHSLGPNEYGYRPRLKPLLVTAEQAGASLAICRTKVYGCSRGVHRAASAKNRSLRRHLGPSRRPFPTNQGSLSSVLGE